MSISPVDSSVAQADPPAAAVGKVAPVKDPIVSAGTSAAPAVHADQPISDKQVADAIDTLNKSAFSDAGLNFSRQSGFNVVALTDVKTKEVIAQLPSKAALALAQVIDNDEKLRGNLVNDKA